MSEDRFKPIGNGRHSVIALLLLGLTLAVVFQSIPLLVGTVRAVVSGGRVDHDIWDIAGAGLLVSVTAVLVAAFLLPKRLWRTAPASTPEEDREERQAWLADLREQGAPWRQRMAHRLSMVFVAIPVMALRRGFVAGKPRKLTPKERVSSLTNTIPIVVLYNHQLHEDWGTWGWSRC